MNSLIRCIEEKKEMGLGFGVERGSGKSLNLLVVSGFNLADG